MAVNLVSRSIMHQTVLVVTLCCDNLELISDHEILVFPAPPLGPLRASNFTRLCWFALAKENLSFWQSILSRG